MKRRNLLEWAVILKEAGGVKTLDEIGIDQNTSRQAVHTAMKYIRKVYQREGKEIPHWAWAMRRRITVALIEAAIIDTPKLES